MIKTASTEVIKGQRLEVGSKSKFLSCKIKILYEDSHLIAIEKPKGLLSVATAFEKEDTAHAQLKLYHQRPVYVVHRLDQDTSGVMLFRPFPRGISKTKNTF